MTIRWSMLCGFSGSTPGSWRNFRGVSGISVWTRPRTPPESSTDHPHAGGTEQNLFLVGDEDQSIYGFRAADPSALVRFPEDWPGARVLRLEQNYRSTREIVAAADRFIQKNTSRLPKHMRAVRGSGPAPEEISVYDRQRLERWSRRPCQCPCFPDSTHPHA